MAWLSVGQSNKELLSLMIQNRVFKTHPQTAYNDLILEGFKNTDRGDFVFPNDRLLAYQDRPYKNQFVHISCPHMYVTVLEALELERGQSFLNVGSGSGYLSCIISYILGENGLSHGIDTSEAVVKHSQECIKLWLEKLHKKYPPKINTSSQPQVSQDRISIVHGNAFDVDICSSVSICKYDRIYVGAGCPDRCKSFFYSMLSDDGILVVPVNEKNQLMKIKKFAGSVYSVKGIASVSFAPMVVTNQNAEFNANTITTSSSSASSTPAQDPSESLTTLHVAPEEVNNITIIPLHELHCNRSNSRSSVRLPPVLWAPSKARHSQFPTEFKTAVFNILLASSFDRPKLHPTSRSQSSCSSTETAKNGTCNDERDAAACCSLPVYIWYYILSFTSRDWFVPVRSPEQFVKLELNAERMMRKRAEEKYKSALAMCKVAEKERDLYKVDNGEGNERKLSVETIDPQPSFAIIIRD